jgi:uncharacterized membrane protein YbhN (UPF0104 family)
MPTIKIITMALLLYISASYTPFPGASGAQEGGFMIYLKNIFPSGQIFPALLMWRLFTYYLTLLIGAVTAVIQTTHSIVKAPRSKQEVLEAPVQILEEQKEKH